MDDCIFCKIIRNELPSFKIWEDDKHLAFLSIFPNTPGVTVLVTKNHFDSYFADLPDDVLTDLIKAAKKVAKQIDKNFDDVGRTGLVFEGFGVNHIHIKLFPLHGTKNDQWQQHRSNIKNTFDTYPGYISSHDGPRETDENLKITSDKLSKL